MNKEYKQTEIGKVPKEWEVVKLSDVSSDFIGGGTPVTTNPEYWDGDIAWMTSAHIIGKEITTGQEFITKKGLENSATNLIPQDNLLVATRVGIGKVAVNKISVAISQDLTGVIVDKTKARSDFLYWGLRTKKNKLKSLAQGSTIKGILKEDLGKLKLPLPPLPEQKKIAEVLSTVDNAIQKIDEAIASTQKLKKGLMQELLTKGIGRGTLQRALKDTVIGRIPKEWEVARLGDEPISEIRGNKTANHSERVAFIPMELVSESKILVDYEIRPMNEVKSFTYCERGDLLLAKITPSLENGKQGIVPDNIPQGFALATTEVFPISCKGIDRLFLYYLLKFPKHRNKIIASMIGTTGRQRASKESVENLFIPLPPLPEQKKIAEILSTVDEKLALLNKRKERFTNLKKGLMNELLTGKKRVRI